MTLTSRNGTSFPDLQVVAGSRTTVPSGNTAYTEIVDGGMDALTFEIPESERVAYPQVWGKNGTPIKLQVHSDETAAMLPGDKIWEGTLWKVGPGDNGMCKVVAAGGSMRMRRSYQDVMFSIHAMSPWGERDDEDANGPRQHENFSGGVQSSKLHYKAEANPYGFGNSFGFTIVVDGAKARKFKAVIEKNLDLPDLSIRVRTHTAPLPNRDASQMIQIGNLVNLGSANPDGTVIERTYQSPANRALAKNAINVDLMASKSTGFTLSQPRNVWLRQVVVYDRATDDTYYSSDAMTTLAALMNLNASKVVAYTSPIVLPLFHQRSSSLDALADLMSTYQQAFWLVGFRNAGDGKFELTFTTWGGANTTTWYTTYEALKGHSLENSRDVVNAQQVYYRTLSGRQKFVTRFADGLSGRPADPFAGSEFAYGSLPIFGEPIDMPDRQSNNTLALGVADLAIKERAVDRLQGDLRLTSLWTATAGGTVSGTEKPACFAHAGDQLVVVNFPEAGAGGLPGPKTLRLYQKDGDDWGVGFTTDNRPTSVERFLARREKLMERKNQSGA